MVGSFVGQSGMRTFWTEGTLRLGHSFLTSLWIPATSAADGWRLEVLVMICGPPLVQPESATNQSARMRPTCG